MMRESEGGGVEEKCRGMRVRNKVVAQFEQMNEWQYNDDMIIMFWNIYIYPIK